MAALSTTPTPLPPLGLSSRRPTASLFLYPATTLSRRRSRLPILRSPARHSHRFTPVVAAQSDLFKAIQTTWRAGKDVIESGSNFVPEIVPRPIAKIGVAGVAVTVALFLLKSLLSTAFFVLGMMGVIYFIYIASNKDEGPRGGGGGGSTSTEDESLEEARRIMEKYK